MRVRHKSRPDPKKPGTAKYRMMAHPGLDHCECGPSISWLVVSGIDEYWWALGGIWVRT